MNGAQICDWLPVFHKNKDRTYYNFYIFQLKLIYIASKDNHETIP